MLRDTLLALTVAAFTAQPVMASDADTPLDLFDTAVAAGNFTTLLAALSAAGMTEELKTSGPFTLFAPTDAAFAKLPEGTVNALLKPGNKRNLVLLMTYHLVPGVTLSGDLVDGESLVTVQGSGIHIGTAAGVRVNDANLTTADIAASNGVIQVIDAVIMP